MVFATKGDMFAGGFKAYPQMLGPLVPKRPSADPLLAVSPKALLDTLI